MTENEPGASELYEFDAPSHVENFMELVNAETDDRWFGKIRFQTSPPGEAGFI